MRIAIITSMLLLLCLVGITSGEFLNNSPMSDPDALKIEFEDVYLVAWQDNSGNWFLSYCDIPTKSFKLFIGNETGHIKIF